MESSNNLNGALEDDLVVICHHQNAGRPINKRTYQKRRRSRACDACRYRKTKCDAFTEGICTSCASASLLCKFTETKDGKKKIGAARRLRMLETTVQELSEKLKLAEAKLESGVHDNDAINPYILPSSESHITQTHRRDGSPPASTAASLSPDDRSRRSSILQQPRKLLYSSGGGGLFVGSTSSLGFLSSVQGYAERLGYDTASLLSACEDSEAALYPLNLSPCPEASQIMDLRALLPTKEKGKKLLDIFYYNTARCIPIFYWPIIVNKFERAYDAPIFADDQTSVTNIFCVLMAIYAYSSICSDNSEFFEAPNYKRGWHFFEYVKKFHDLCQPMYSLANAEVLMVMAMYLDVAALPSPSWMTVGCLARVCQDLGLHRKPADDNFAPVELEHRSRIFWYTFLLDRKLALQFGRPPIFDEEELDMDGPGKNDTNDLVDQTFEAAVVRLSTPDGANLMRKLIAYSRYIDPILRLNPQISHEQRIELRIHDIEQKLDVLERSFPQSILDWEASSALDPVLVNSAMMAMAIRLSLYRHFTDASLDRGLRTRCFIRTVGVGKATVHLLYRMMKFPDWEKGFRLCQSGLTYQHIFKISVIFLLAATIFTKQFKVATNAELNICIKALEIAAPVRLTAMQSLDFFNEVAKMLKNKQVPGSLDNLMDSSPTTIPSNSLVRGRDTPFEATPNTAGISSTTSTPCLSMPTTLTRDAGNLHIGSIGLSNEVPVGNNTAPTFWPTYESFDCAALGFSNLSVPSPKDNTAWFNQIDPSYWALMESVLSNKANL